MYYFVHQTPVIMTKLMRNYGTSRQTDAGCTATPLKASAPQLYDSPLKVSPSSPAFLRASHSEIKLAGDLDLIYRRSL